MDYTTYTGLFLPLLGFLFLLATSDFLGRKSTAIVGCGTVFFSFCCFSSLLISYINESLVQESFTLFHWIPIEGINADFTLHLDPLSLLMTLIITGVGFLIHLYSVGYMEHDPDVNRYFACLNFFIFAMLLLVLSGDLLLLFVGWEGVGLASYLLIGFWYEKPIAAAAAVKAFVVNRVGDLGFLLALLLTFHLFGTSNIAEITHRASIEFTLGAPIVTVLTLLYFIGAIGKSAQFPLHTWLADAMAGPTPVSALIHAATMVTAGVYLIVRLHELFVLAPTTLEIIGVIGGGTALFAALAALAQTELKKVLAYSTMSQLGFMFLACGIADFYGAMFHLTMHAFVKGLLFLAAGNVLHMAHEITDMREMGGLTKKLPKTHILFLIGALALSGIPPLAAFFSKDLVLEQEYLLGHYTLFYIGLAASICTGAYLTRAYCMTFLGPSHTPKKIYDAIKEAPMIMIFPMILLALLSIGGGFIGFASGHLSFLEEFLGQVGVTLADLSHRGESLFTPQTIQAISGAFTAVIATWALYTYFGGIPENKFKSLKYLLRNAFYIDAIYFFCITRPVRGISRLIANVLEPKIFEQSIGCTVDGIERTAQRLQYFQNGQIRSYTAWIVVGVVFTLIYITL